MESRVLMEIMFGIAFNCLQAGKHYQVTIKLNAHDLLWFYKIFNPFTSYKSYGRLRIQRGVSESALALKNGFLTLKALNSDPINSSSSLRSTHVEKARIRTSRSHKLLREERLDALLWSPSERIG